MKRILIHAVAMAVLLIVGMSYARSAYDATGPATEGTLVEVADRLGVASGATTIIDYAHAKRHAGDSYSIYSYVTVSANSQYSFLLTTGTGTQTHLTYLITSSATSTIGFYRSPNASGGNAQTLVNDNENSSKTASMTLTTGPTITTYGTLIASHNIVDGTLQGVGDVNVDEMILREGTKYLLLITAGTATSIVDYQFKMYED